MMVIFFPFESFGYLKYRNETHQLTIGRLGISDGCIDCSLPMSINFVKVNILLEILNLGVEAHIGLTNSCCFMTYLVLVSDSVVIKQ